MGKDLSVLSIDQLLDEIYRLRTWPLDGDEWKNQQAARRNLIVDELKKRPPDDLVTALIREARLNH